MTLSGSTPTILLDNSGTTTIGSILAGSNGLIVGGNLGAMTTDPTLILSGPNTYTGATQITSGDTLSLIGTGTNGALNSASTVTLASGILNYAPSGMNAQSISGLTVNSGQSSITVAANDTLNVGSITRGGGTVDFTTTGSITTTATNTDNILGPWATVNNGAGWATVTTSGAIMALPSGSYSST